MLPSHAQGDGGRFPFPAGPAADHSRAGSGADGRGHAWNVDRHARRYDFVSIYEFFAAEYGWLPDAIERRITDSQLLGYLDAAGDRRSQESEVEVDRITLGVNSGYLITHDAESLRRWRMRHRSTTPDPQQFTATVGRLAAKFPGKVKTH